MHICPDGAMVMQSHARTVASPLQREDVHNAVSQAAVGC